MPAICSKCLSSVPDDAPRCSACGGSVDRFGDDEANTDENEVESEIQYPGGRLPNLFDTFT